MVSLMAGNIFEGARRITKLIALVWVMGVSLFILMQDEPGITGTYSISRADRRLGPNDHFCRDLSHFRQEGFTVKTKKGTEAHIPLCFPAEKKEFVGTIASGVKFAVTAPIVANEQEVISYVQSEEAEFKERAQQERAIRKRPSPVRGFREYDPKDGPIISLDGQIIWDWDGQAFADHV